MTATLFVNPFIFHFIGSLSNRRRRRKRYGIRITILFFLFFFFGEAEMFGCCRQARIDIYIHTHTVYVFSMRCCLCPRSTDPMWPRLQIRYHQRKSHLVTESTSFSSSSFFIFFFLFCFIFLYNRLAAAVTAYVYEAKEFRIVVRGL